MHEMTLHNDESKYCQYLLDEQESLRDQFIELFQDEERPGREYYMGVLKQQIFLNLCKIYHFTQEIMDAEFIHRKESYYVS